jgi:hypothetical protein
LPGFVLGAPLEGHALAERIERVDQIEVSITTAREVLY